MYNEVPPILCYYFSYWQDVEAENFEMYVRGEERRVVFSFRTEDDLFAVFVGFPADEFPPASRDREAHAVWSASDESTVAGPVPA